MLNIERNINSTASIILGLSILIILLTYLFEYILELPPCKLCLYQRIPYFIVIFSGILIYFKQDKFFLLISLLMFTINLCISSFHSLVERKLISYDTGCSSNSENFDNIDQLRSFLEKAPIIKCDEIIFSLFGLSLANLNIIILLILITLSFLALRQNG